MTAALLLLRPLTLVLILLVLLALPSLAAIEAREPGPAPTGEPDVFSVQLWGATSLVRAERGADGKLSTLGIVPLSRGDELVDDPRVDQ